MAKRKCKHETVTIVWHPETGQEIAIRCSKEFGCGAWLGYGKDSSNDDPRDVKVEIRAAEIAGSRRGQPGWLKGEDEASGNIDYLTGCDLLDEDFVGWNAAWLAREISSHDDRGTRDANDWPWDPTRPVAGQYEEWLASRSTPVRNEQARADIKTWTAERMAARRAPADTATIAVQTRHDVAASVARHADLSVAQLAADVAPIAAEPDAASHPDIADEGPAAQLLATAGQAGTEPALVGGFIVVSCIKGEPTSPRAICGVSWWPTREAAERALSVICEDPDHPDPDDFGVVPARAVSHLGLAPLPLAEHKAALERLSPTMRAPDEDGEHLASQERPAARGRDLDAINYEERRAGEPDCRDEDDVHVWEDGTVTLTSSYAEAPIGAVVNTFAEDDAPSAESLVAAVHTTLESDDNNLLAEIAHAPPRDPPADQQPLRSWPPNTGTPDERTDADGDS